MEVISRTFPSKTRPHEASRPDRSILDSISRGATVLPQIMAQHGYGIGPGPSRSSQWDDRAEVQSRSETDGAATAASHSDAFGRPASFVDGSSLFQPSSSSSYEHMGGGVRAEHAPHALLNIHGQHPNDSQALTSYSNTFSHHPTHDVQYAQPSAHASHSPSQAFQHPHNQHHYHQQHSHQHHLQHAADQPLGMPMAGDFMGSHSLGMHHAPNSYAMHHHSDHQQASLEGPRKGQDRTEAAEPHTPRPPNAWILYRSQKFREIQQNRESQTRSGSTDKPKSQAEISRIISQLWQNETSAVKQKFEAMADEKKLAHQKMYPTYRYRPKKKSKPKQSASGQVGDQRHTPDGKFVKKSGYGSYTDGSHDYDASEGSSSAGHSTDRKVGNEILRSSGGNQGVGTAVHDLAGRELMSRKPNYADRRERGDLQVPSNYGRSVSGGASFGDGHSFSYNSTRMHPYGDRPSSLLRQESLRAPDVFGDTAPPSSSTYPSGHWPDSDTLSGSSGTNFFDGTRSTSTGYSILGNARTAPSSLINSNTMGSTSLLALSPPQQQLPRQSVPSQHLQHSIEYLDSGMNLNGLPGASSNFRPSPVTHHVARFGPSFGESRSELASGLAVPGTNESVSEPLDPNRRMPLQ